MGKLDLSRLPEFDPTFQRTLKCGRATMDLPQSKAALLAHNRTQAERGHPGAIDQTAGDLDNLDQPNPLPTDFFAHRVDVRGHCRPSFAPVRGSPTGFAEGYYPNPASAVKAINHYLGLNDDEVTVHSASSGRAVISNVMAARATALKALCPQGRFALIHGPFAWPGYAAELANLSVQTDAFCTPLSSRVGFGMTADAVRESIIEIRRNGYNGISMIVPIVPDNPTGTLAMDPQEIIKLAEIADEQDTFVFLDWFYHYVAEVGKESTIGWSELNKNLPPELRKRLLLLLGTTKGFGADSRYAEAVQLAPKQELLLRAGIIGGTRSTYATREAALLATTAFSFPGGPQKAMGGRYTKLRDNQRLLKKALDQHGIAAPERSGSYYSTAVLADSEGVPFVLDRRGEPSTNPHDTMNVLRQAGIGVASPDLWRPYENGSLSGATVRLSFATTQADLARMNEGFARLTSRTLKSTYGN